MELPTNTWGKKVHASRIETRKKTVVQRIFARQPNTTIFRNGRQMALIQKAGGTMGIGWLDIQLDEEPNLPWVWRGDKPISVTQFNCGQQYDGVTSDPFQMICTPLEQYQTEIVFNTPGIRGGFGFPDNYVNIVYLANEFGEIPEDLEFAKVNNGEFSWTKVSSISPAPGWQFKDDEIINDKRQYYSKTIMLPGDGVYKLRAKDPFAAYAYGFSNYDSYGFPTSVALGDLDYPDTVAPDPKWTSICGDVEGATVTDKPDDERYRSNLALIIFHKDESFNYKFKYEEFTPGEDVSTTWECKVIDPLKDARAVITFTDRRGNDTTIVLEYFVSKFAIEPKDWNFGKLQKGEVVTKDFKVRNIGNGMARLSDLKLWRNNQNFELINFALPVDLQPQQAMDFTVKFTALAEGEFRDSIGVGDTCVFYNLAFVQAAVGTPQIEVDDRDWGDMIVNSAPVSKPVEIRNLGSTDLVITSYSGPSDPDNVFVPTFDRTISQTTPLVIPKGGNYTFNVAFSPKAEKSYTDQIIFHNNATGTDSIAILTGKGIKADLLATGYDWKEKRINRSNFPMGPYDIPDKSAIKLYNAGSADVRINQIDVQVISGDRNAFIFNVGELQNKVIKPNDSLYVEVKFQPNTVGLHEILISYPGNSANSSTTSSLKGIGIMPKIATFDMDYDTTIIQDFPGVQKRTVRISNIAWDDGTGLDVSDSLTITALNITPGGSIATNLTSWGSEGFRFDINSLRYSGTSSNVQLPVTLQPNEYIEIDGEFVSVRVGNHSAKITVVNDAEEVSSTWTGFGLAQGVYATGDETKICIGETEVLDCIIGNSGSGQIQITSISFDPPLPEFEFVNAADANGFPLGSNQFDTVQVRYTPTSVGVVSTRLKFENSTLDNPVVYAPVKGESVHYSRTTSNATTLTNGRVVVNQKFLYTIDLNPGDDLTMADVKEFYVRIQYNKDFIAALQNEITIGSLLQGKFDMATSIQIIDQAKNIEQITLTFTAIGNNHLDGNGQLVQIGFSSFLPWYENNEEQTKLDSATISFDLAAVGTSCVDMTGNELNVYLEPTCVENLRTIVISGESYAFQQIAPNPVGPSGATISYSVAIEAFTEITLYNSNGEVVKELVAKKLTPGKYTVDLPVGDLSSGSYLCTMKCGPYASQQNVVIVK